MSFRSTYRSVLIGLVLLATTTVGTLLGAAPQTGQTAPVSPDLIAGLKWRNIGPFHGGRISAVSGAIGAGQAGVFYVGAPEGGVWKTTSAGVTWLPIFDQFTAVDSVGAVQVAPSDPNIVYVGTGDSVQGSLGDGMYKSSDAGKTWTHIGLEDTVKINKICVDPKDPNLVVASTQGDGRHTGAGIFRSTDGGKTWENTLKPEGANGTRDVEYAYDMPNLMFATSEGSGGRGGGGAGGAAPAGAPAPTNGTALYKSSDSGKSWKKVDTLPPYNGRISVAVAMHTNGQRVYVVGGALQGGSGLYRSDDQGATWQHMAGNDTRVGNGQGAYSSAVAVDSQNPDILYTVSTTVYQSKDGGKTFTGFKGAPGGEDPHDIWIDPTNGQRMLFGVDQGPGVTLDGGATWSGYFQIPIAQTYHVTTDNQYPYWVLASMQDTGSIMTRSRSDQGEITEFDWQSLPSSEFGTVVTDPKKPTTVYGVGYGAGQGSGLIKIDLATGQWGNVSPSFGTDSDLYTAGRDFYKRFDTTFDKSALYVGYNCIVVTRDGGLTWKEFSPNLTVAKGQPLTSCAADAMTRRAAASTAAVASAAGASTPVTPPAGAARGRGRGAAATPLAGTTPAAPAAGAGAGGPAAGGGRAGGGGSISDFSISTKAPGVVWAGSSNGQIYNTMDGGRTWNNVTNFTDLPANANFVTVEAGHSDINTAYVLANAGGGRGAGAGAAAAEQHYIYRTHDAGKTWTRIVNGFPVDERTGSQIHVIREDPKQKGLLFAGTETTVFASFDDGDHWQSLRLNLPSTSIRDMVFHTDDNMNDLVICTYGRGFWVLDDMSPLRDVAQKSAAISAAPAYLFKPGDAIRARQSSNWDQPINPEKVQAKNPPYGALLYYHLSKAPAGEIKLQIFDSANKLVRSMTSTQPQAYERPPYPDYWLKPVSERALSTNVGTNRFNWDLRYDDPPGYNADINNQMNAVPGSVTPAPHGPLAMPGAYTVKLIVDGQTYAQPLVVHNDPRIGEGAAVMTALRTQQKLTLSAYQGMKDSAAGNDEVAAVRAQIAALAGASLPPDVATAVTALDAKLATFGGASGRGGRGGGGGGGGGGRGGGAGAAGGTKSFTTLNGSFNTIVALTQNGIDMAPGKAQIDTYESGCKDFSATVKAWKAMQTVDLVGFNALLTKGGQKPLTITPTALTVPASCTFTPPVAAMGRH